MIAVLRRSQAAESSCEAAAVKPAAVEPSQCLASATGHDGQPHDKHGSGRWAVDAAVLRVPSATDSIGSCSGGRNTPSKSRYTSSWKRCDSSSAQCVLQRRVQHRRLARQGSFPERLENFPVAAQQVRARRKRCSLQLRPVVSALWHPPLRGAILLLLSWRTTTTMTTTRPAPPTTRSTRTPPPTATLQGRHQLLVSGAAGVLCLSPIFRCCRARAACGRLHRSPL